MTATQGLMRSGGFQPLMTSNGSNMYRGADVIEAQQTEYHHGQGSSFQFQIPEKQQSE
jgi:hypothetical protein